MKKKNLSLLIILLCLLGLPALSFSQPPVTLETKIVKDGIIYTSKDYTTYELELDDVIDPENFGEEFIIPSSVTDSDGNARPVVAVGDGAFRGCRSLKTITIPESVTSIGSDAFAGCIGLKTITIPESVTSIEYGAFAECSSLESITIPKNVVQINDEAFASCYSLTSIVLPENLTSIGGGAFRDCRSLTSIVIPEKVISIEWLAFYGCSNLESITIPLNLKNVGERAFGSLRGLQTIKSFIVNPMASDYKWDKDAFQYSPQSCRVIVPNGTIEQYKKTEPWSYFLGDFDQFDSSYYSLTKEQIGEGNIKITGVDYLSVVFPNTEITITANPAEGYVFKSLIVNDEEVLNGSKLIVKGNLKTKGIFEKKKFAVIQENDGNGSLIIRGAEDLSKVPYKTELTITAKPNEGCDFATLTANGLDFVNNKVVVKGMIKFKATFKKRTFLVIQETAVNGRFSISGFEDLSAVPYGTELTIKATPKEGYELTSLMANGVEIQNNKVVIKEATSIKAIFSKKVFTVNQDVENGLLIISGADNLSAVPYGTELTVMPKANKGYRLKSLTANNKDIRSSKKFIVKENVIVKAIFEKEIAIETISSEAILLYPNPAKTIVTIEGLKANESVFIYSLEGKQIISTKANLNGKVILNVDTLTNGIYLVKTNTVTKKLEVCK